MEFSFEGVTSKYFRSTLNYQVLIVLFNFRSFPCLKRTRLQKARLLDLFLRLLLSCWTTSVLFGYDIICVPGTFWGDSVTDYK